MSWPLPGTIASPMNTNYERRHARSPERQLLGSARRGGLRTTQASTGCSTGCSWSAWPTHHHPLHRQTLRNWRSLREKLQNSGKLVLGRRGSQIVDVVLAHFPTLRSWLCRPQLPQHRHLSPSRAAKVAKAKEAGKEVRRPSTRPRRGSSERSSTVHEKSEVYSAVGETIPSVTISRIICALMRNAGDSIVASVVVVPSRTTSAIASNKGSETCPEKRPRSLLRQSQLHCRFLQNLHL